MRYSALNLKFNGDPSLTLSHIMYIPFSGVDTEKIMIVLKGVVMISNGPHAYLQVMNQVALYGYWA